MEGGAQFIRAVSGGAGHKPNVIDCALSFQSSANYAALFNRSD
jgi:hypothetical protein